MSLALNNTINELKERVAALELIVAQLQAQVASRRTLTVPRNG